jgi:acyl carrier protein
MDAQIEASVDPVARVVTTVLGDLATSGVTAPTADMTIQDDLGIDSVTFMFAVVQVQEQLGLDFFSGSTKAASVRTVGDFIRACVACGADAQRDSAAS